MTTTRKVSRLIAIKFYDKLVALAPPGIMVSLPEESLRDLDVSTEGEQMRAYRLVDWLIHDVMEPFYLKPFGSKDFSEAMKVGDTVQALQALPIIEDRTHAYSASEVLLKLSQEMRPNHLDYSQIIPVKFGAEAARLAIFSNESVQRMRLVKAVITACGPIAQSLGETFWQKATNLLQELVISPDVKCSVSPHFNKGAVPLQQTSDEAFTKRVQSMISEQAYLRILEVAGEGRVSSWIRAAIDEKLNRVNKPDEWFAHGEPRAEDPGADGEGPCTICGGTERQCKVLKGGGHYE